MTSFTSLSVNVLHPLILWTIFLLDVNTIEAQVRSPLNDAIRLTELAKERTAAKARSAALLSIHPPTLAADGVTQVHAPEVIAARAVVEALRTEAVAILGAYIPPAAGVTDAPGVVNYFTAPASNPFTASSATVITESASGGVIGTAVNAASGMLNAATALDVTNLATGLADFLIERTKTELNTAFFRRFQEMLESDDFKDARILFPETTKLLKVIGTEIYRYDAFLNSLRTAFDNDLRAMLGNAEDVLENHKAEISAVNGLYPSLVMALHAAADLDRGTHPGQVIDGMAFSDEMGQLKGIAGAPEFGVAANGIQLAAMISESLRSGKKERYWATREELDKLQDETTLKLYMGLLYEWSKTPKYKVITFNVSGAAVVCGRPALTGSVDVQKLLDEVAACWAVASPEVGRFKGLVAGMATKVNALEDRIQVLRAAPATADKLAGITSQQRRRIMFEALSDVVNGTLDVIEHTYAVEELPWLNITVPAKAKQVVGYLHSAQRIATGVNQKQYATALTELITVLKTVADEQGTGTVSFGPAILDRVLRYGTFMAALVESENPEQAKAAIEAVALPPGSYSIKRNSAFSASLNGYLGGFAAHERIDGADNSTTANNFGLTAPVGVALNWGNICRRWKHKASIGLFFPLIDVGAVASFRFSDTTSASVPTISLGDIISPGMYLELGIPRTPLSLGFGMQMGPRLREVTAEESTIGELYFRYGATLKVDIPILHFHASTSRLSAPTSMKAKNRIHRRIAKLNGKL